MLAIEDKTETPKKAKKGKKEKKEKKKKSEGHDEVEEAAAEEEELTKSAKKVRRRERRAARRNGGGEESALQVALAKVDHNAWDGEAEEDNNDQMELPPPSDTPAARFGETPARGRTPNTPGSTPTFAKRKAKMNKYAEFGDKWLLHDELFFRHG